METLQTLSFGALLKRFRRAARLTQDAFAERAGYSAVYVRMLERGARTPLPATIDLLSAALGLAPHEREALATAALRQRQGLTTPLSSAAIDSPSTSRPEMISSDRTPIQIFLIADLRGYTQFTLTHGDE